MNLIKAVNAYMALGILSKEKFAYSDALKIINERRKLKQFYELFAEEERKIVQDVSKKDENGKPISYPDGHFEFETETSKKEYSTKMRELSTFDIEEVDTISISPPDSITPDLLESLEGFVIFEEADDAGAS